MKELWVVDCETDPFEKGVTDIRPFIWGATDGVKYQQFDTTSDMIAFFSEIEATVYAHNGGKFDYFFVFDFIEPFSDMLIINGRLSKFQIGLSEFRDSWNILPFPLGAYNKDDIDYSIFKKSERDKPKNRKKICDYLKGDVRYLWELVSAFQSEYGKHLTLAGAAMAQWRRISGEKNPKSTRGFYGEYSKYYYGGRVECFKTGIIKKPFKVIDINSAYPHAMIHQHPWGVDSIALSKLPRSGIEQCFITLECDSSGAFPYRDAKKGTLTFPHRRDVYHVTGWEFIAALETDTIKNYRIIKVIKFGEEINFKSYVDYFFAKKENAAQRKAFNPFDIVAVRDYIFAKLFLNSLYGKLAANPEEYDEFFVYPPEFVEQMQRKYGWIKQCEIGPHALGAKPLSEEKQNFYNVATAASITGFVRAKLLRAIKECHEPLYCDTDSLACVDTGALDLHPTALGAWDVEAVCDEGAIAGKKLYAFKIAGGDKFKIASKGAKLTAQEIYRVASGESVKYIPIAPTFSLTRGIVCTERLIQKTG